MSEKIVFEESKSSEYRSIYTTGIFGSLGPDDAYMILFLDRVQTTSREDGAQKIAKINREAQAEVHMSPVQFKRIYLWMQNHINQYEKAFGIIVLEPKSKEVEGSGGNRSYTK